MMRSPNYFSVACRAPNGEIVLTTENVEKTWIGRQKWLKAPFLRGTLALLDSMALGVKAMRFSSEVQIDERYQKPSEKNETSEKAPSKAVQDIAIGLTIVASLGLGFLLFNFVPNLLGESARNFGVTSGTVINFIVEIVKAIFVFGYILLISQMKEIREVFKYHGAEHKAINAMEAGETLTMENAAAQTRLHPRCGTSFIVVVLLVGLVISTFTPRYIISGQQGNYLLDVVARFLLELFVLLPIISGVSYELIRFAGKFRNAWLVNVLFKPGLMTQYLTTREPEAGQIEVALAALKAVVVAEQTGELQTSASVAASAPAPAPA